ncbi:MAG: ATPase, T2SS/T4P/T4SS family [Candidatus Micrarchaeia archaeon]
MRIIVPDTGALIDGRITEMLSKKGGAAKVIISKAALAELEHQANAGRETGLAGLSEISRLGELAAAGKIELDFSGSRPKHYEIEGASLGEIDALIREEAKLYDGAILITTDKVQAAVAKAEGILVEYLEPIVQQAILGFSHFFDTGDVMSLHIKEGEKARVKRGLPGKFDLVDFSEKKYTKNELNVMLKHCVEFAKRDENSFIEIDKLGATVIQAGEYRITFTRQPFSESSEITVVKPLVKLALSDYELSGTLNARLAGKAEGIIVAGPPGSGKSTFVSALAESYADANKIVKTLEQPRDLQVSRRITQYAPLEGSFENASDILLLVRPDYTIYDEVRKTDDFRVFADLRMAGVGMVGVIHASKPIDAVQRFFGKVDLGLIPQVIDTVIFIEAGRVAKSYSLDFDVRTPSGMMEKDLARPVISVRDLETGTIEYEIYKYGEETVVSPLRAARVGKPERFNKFEGNNRGHNVQPWKKGFDGDGQFWKKKGKSRR